MIYSKKLQTHIPVNVTCQTYKRENCGDFSRYIVKDGKIMVGHVDLTDTDKGVYVEFIKNENPELYSGFGEIADQIEVEHCLKKGLKNFNIESNAALNSHALHYLRGKRFSFIDDLAQRNKLIEKFHTDNVNLIVRTVIALTPKGERFKTSFLGAIPMYMPKNLIKKYLEIIKKTPLLG